MAAREQIFPVTDFRGLGNPFIFTGDPKKVRTMTNVRSQFGRIIGRNGYTTLPATGAAKRHYGFVDFKASNNTVTLFTIVSSGTGATGAEAFTFNTSTNTWTSRGTRQGVQGNHVDFVTHANTLYFHYNSTSGILSKWTGSGNVADVTGSPTGRFVTSFAGRLLIGYAAGGGNTAQEVRFDAADNGTTWPTANIINLRETPGAIQRLLPLGKALYAYKTDGATILRFVGTTVTTFSQERAPMSVGLLASGSIVEIPGVGHMLLATDGRVHVNDGSLVQPVLADLNNTILDDINLAEAKNSIASVDLPNSIYTLLFPGSGSTVLNKRLDFNYQTGEFTIFTYSPGFNYVYYSQYANNDLLNPSYTLVGSNDDDPFKLDTGLTDNGATVNYEWQSDWLSMQSHLPKALLKADLLFDSASQGEVEVAIATDLDPDFKQAKRLSINVVRNQPDALVRYNLVPTIGHLFNVRLRFFPRTQGSDIVFKGLFLYHTPLDSPARDISSATRGLM